MPRRVNIVGTGDTVFLQDNRQPVHRVLLYDGVSDSISDIVANKSEQVPLDITDQVEEVTVREELGNAGTCNFSFVPRPNGLTPFHFLGRKYVKVLYSDRRLVKESTDKGGGGDLFEIFTGVVAGQPGYTNDRDQQANRITVQGYDRQWNWNRRGKKINSPPFDVDTDLGDVAVELATNKTWGMGLDRTEVAFGKQAFLSKHSVMQLRDDTAINLLDQLLFPTNKTAQFDGSGRLVSRDWDFAKAPVRVWDELDGVVKNYGWPQELVDVINVVRVLGLDANITEIEHPTQNIIELNGTVGYFQQEFEETYFFTDDHRGRARGIFLAKEQINGFLPLLGSSIDISQVSDFAFKLSFKTPYNAWLFVLFFLIYVSLIILATTYLYYDIAAAIWLSAGLSIMQQVGTFHAQIDGDFFEQVYAQIASEARWSHTSLEETRRKEIRNDLISDQVTLDTIADRELIKETVKGSPRDLDILEDTALEPADIVETRDGSRFFILSIERRLRRNAGEDPIMKMKVLKIRDGNEFNGIAGVGEFP